ncbi:Amidohydrolase family protein [Microbulbifer donghaiensis]|uniref:Amidohydrolase family protein n=1 Tax=Microbulbifer donghaiensis TaxID=494016 RepID=A0A1M4VIQ3_9GAMM|nr:amidohydrolase family protein [Microbulbifer donghaiensis]SHE68687.1 Amidohydrolase family protein [Microbulbifer donghaiensis]
MLRNLFQFVFVVTGFLASLSLAADGPQRDYDLLLKNFRLVDVESGQVRDGQLLLIEGNRIAAILPAAQQAEVAAKEVVDLGGNYLIPGLWDMHVHFEGRDLIEDNALLFPVYLAYGITAVRDAASDLAPEVLNWRTEVAERKRLGPRIFTAGQKFEGIDSIWKGDLEVGDRASMLAGMDKLEKMNVDFIKITENTMDPQLFIDTVAEANHRGHLVSTHVPYGVSIGELADAGLSSIEHASYVLRLGNADEAAIAKAVRAGELSKEVAAERYRAGFDQRQAIEGYRMLAQKGVAVTPTLIGGRQLAYLAETDHSDDAFQRYLTQRFMSKYQWRIDRMAGEGDKEREARKARYQLIASQLPLLADAGVVLLAGSDSAALNTYVYPAEALHTELVLFQEAGLSPLQALQAATVNGARFMGQWRDYGSIAEGKRADLVVLTRNPLEDIRATQDIDSVISGGTLYRRPKLDSMLEQAAQARAKLDSSREAAGR